MDLDLVCVESFLVLLEEEHFGRAAATLNVSVSALSKRIHRLERQVGVPLLVRNSASVAGPTPGGASFADRAGPLLREARAARDAARNPRPTVFRLGIPGAVQEYPSRQKLLELGSRFRRTHPGASLHCVGVSYDRMTADLLDGRVDAVWAAGSFHVPGITSVPIAPLVRIGVVGPRSSFADAGEVTWETFLDQTVVFNPEVPADFMKLWWFGDIRAEREARLRPIPARSIQQVHAALTASSAVAISHRLVAGTVPPWARVVELTDAPPAAYTLSRRRQVPPSMLAAFTELVPAVAATLIDP